MGHSLNWCVFCGEWWDDAHWYLNGDTGNDPYPDGKCEQERKAKT